MADDNEDILRKSLDAVDRYRNGLLIGLCLAAALLVAAIVRVGQDLGGRGSFSDGLLLHSIFAVLGVWTGLLALVIVIQITVMTKRILRAIELASRK